MTSAFDGAFSRLSLLIDDVTLLRDRQTVSVHVRFRGGTNHSLRLEVPKNAIEGRRTHAEAMNLIGQWASSQTSSEIAERLNALGYVGGSGHPFTAAGVNYLKWAYRLGNARERPRPEGMLGATDMIAILGCSHARLKQLVKTGQILANKHDGRDWAYLPLGPATGADSTSRGQGCHDARRAGQRRVRNLRLWSVRSMKSIPSKSTR